MDLHVNPSESSRNSTRRKYRKVIFLAHFIKPIYVLIMARHANDNALFSRRDESTVKKGERIGESVDKIASDLL